jgi:hypothetical protein
MAAFFTARFGGFDVPFEDPPRGHSARYGGRAAHPKNVPAEGENWTMPTPISVLNAAISEPSVFTPAKTKVFGLLAELKANAEGAVSVIQSASS